MASARPRAPGQRPRILFVVSEVAPFAKTGGLADVAGSLPKALADLGCDVRVAMPLYGEVDRRRHRLSRTAISVLLGEGRAIREGWVWEGRLPGSAVPVYLLEQPALFDRPGLYQHNGRDHHDNLERFGFFSCAALRVLPDLGWRPDVVHAHDWQAALAAAHLAFGQAGLDPFFAATRSLLTIHNLAFQGVFPHGQWAATHLPDAAFRLKGLEYYGQINCLKGGIVSAGRVAAVSPTYAREIQTSAFGCGLDGVLRARAGELSGILNGIDLEAWNPSTDPHLAARYSARALQGKAHCRRALQERLGLAPSSDMLIGMVQRLTHQKGVDLVLRALPQLMSRPVQVALLGTGEAAYHRQWQEAAARYPGRVASALTFDEVLAHQIEAGADAFLMPSRFEPCGLNQLYSMRYGTVPIVHRVGGLADTVKDPGDGERPVPGATGFVFDRATVEGLLGGVRRALACFAQPAAWRALMRAGMHRDCSWTHSARDYLALYERLIGRGQAPKPAQRRRAG